MTLGDVTVLLKQAGVESARLDARVMWKHVTGMSDADIIVNPDTVLSPEQQSALSVMIQKRIDGVPVAKIIGIKEFYGRNFTVTTDVLDPRPDSETLIEAVLSYVDDATERNWRILDLGTGSGCLILTLLCELPNATGVAVDISEPALAVARDNAARLNVQGRVGFTQSDWLDNVDGLYDIIVSNPPYIETDTIAHLDKDVRLYDPLSALDGGADGLDPYKILFPQIRHYLNLGGIVAVECGFNQAGHIRRLMENPRFDRIRTYTDFGGHERIVSAIAC